MKYPNLCFIFLIAAHFVNFFAGAQTLKQGTAPGDSTETNVPVIVVVPFNPAMYFSDTDHFISAVSDLPAAEVRQAFRATLANNVHGRLDGLYFSINMLTRNDKESRELLQKIYRSQVYTEKFRSILVYSKLTPIKRFWQFFSGKRRKWGISCIDPKPPMPFKKGRLAQTALLDLRSQQVLKEMKELYNADYVLFMNQFRMQTRYQKCLNIANNVYQRDYLLSFTLMDMEGKKLTEGVVGTTYQSSTNNLKTILERNVTLLEDFTAVSVRDGLKTQIKSARKSW